MGTSAAIALELPCREPIADADLHAFYNEALVLRRHTRPGRLVPPRGIARGVRRILNDHWQRVQERCARLSAPEAKLLRHRTRSWMDRVHNRHLTSHRLRIPHTDRFLCWSLPDAVRRRLQHGAEGMDRLALLLVVPRTPSMPADLQPLVYLRAPAERTRSGRASRSASGGWVPVPPARVRTIPCPTRLLIAVE